MTRDEFEQAYAARSGITVEELRDLGRFAVPFDCGEEGCQGWQMAHTTIVGFSSRIRKAFGAQPHTTGQDKPAG